MQQKTLKLKDRLFTAEKLNKIASEIHAVYPEFNKEYFIEQNLAAFPSLELKERIQCISVKLAEFLPGDFEEAVHIITSSLPAPCDPYLTDNDFGDFIYASYGEFIATYSQGETTLELALFALEEITTRFSMEYAIRPFLIQFPTQTLQKLNRWCEHPHYHVRRLVSEGTRPNLPWGQKVNLDTNQTLPLLDLLHSDNTRFVTRSVANHLNDISKVNPNIVLEILEKWKRKSIQAKSELDFLSRHALRTLIKNGDQRALSFAGLSKDSPIKLKLTDFSSRVYLDDFLRFKIELSASAQCTVLVNYVIKFRDIRGKMSRKKVFHLRKTTLKPGETVTLEKKHQMKRNMSTRVLYPGQQQFSLVVNGSVLLTKIFELV
jgi:3-methyladenine DNA glycosylase AlkC